MRPTRSASRTSSDMYFKGTPSRGPGEIARDTKASGGYLNAGTIYDHTHYYGVAGERIRGGPRDQPTHMRTR